MTIGFLSRGINQGRFPGGGGDGYEEFSVWYAQNSFLWNETVKGTEDKYLNSTSYSSPDEVWLAKATS